MYNHQNQKNQQKYRSISLSTLAEEIWRRTEKFTKGIQGIPDKGESEIEDLLEQAEIAFIKAGGEYWVIK